MDVCPTCVQAKQKKEPAGPNATMVATQPYQGLSIDFSFSGSRSSDSDRTKDYVGINGETCWILVTDHFSRRLHGDTRISKASPIHWLRHFLENYSPQCSGKYVHLDQGGELYANPEVLRLFERFGYEIRPTGADSSHQNGPVERAHLTVANAVRSMLTGADLPVKFWPYAFHHYIRIKNAIPPRDKEDSPFNIPTQDPPANQDSPFGAEAPTTEAPTTQAPTTEEPTTMEPTDAPTTEMEATTECMLTFSEYSYHSACLCQNVRLTNSQFSC